MLPANKPRRTIEGVHLTHEPRPIKQIHFSKHSITEHWDIMTLGITMETIRSLEGISKYVYIDIPESRPNLQNWIDRLGPALYNPITFAYRENRNNRVNGCHRLAVLEALDFDVVYVYLLTGSTKYTLKETEAMKENNMNPTIPTVEYPVLVPHK